MDDPYHEGELKVQARAGESAMAARNGAIIANRIIGGALPFLRQQPMAVFASQSQNEMWCSIVFGRPGFMESEDGYSVDFDLAQMWIHPRDPFWKIAEAGDAVGMLAIDLGSRRRIRINGTLTRSSESHLRLAVREAYPNCPKYITHRQVKLTGVEGDQELSDAEGRVFGASEQSILERADTLFIATTHSSRGADASHRGGRPGFVRILDRSTLQIPDYLGNSMFNTLGNLAVNPLAGIAVADFENGRLLQITGTAETVWNEADPANLTGGTGRFLLFRVGHWISSPLPGQLKTELLDYSPYNPIRR